MAPLATAAAGQMPGQMPTRKDEPEEEESKTASEVRLYFNLKIFNFFFKATKVKIRAPIPTQSGAANARAVSVIINKIPKFL